MLQNAAQSHRGFFMLPNATQNSPWMLYVGKRNAKLTVCFALPNEPQARRRGFGSQKNASSPSVFQLPKRSQSSLRTAVSVLGCWTQHKAHHLRLCCRTQCQDLFHVHLAGRNAKLTVHVMCYRTQRKLRRGRFLRHRTQCKTLTVDVLLFQLAEARR